MWISGFYRSFWDNYLKLFIALIFSTTIFDFSGAVAGVLLAPYPATTGLKPKDTAR